MYLGVRLCGVLWNKKNQNSLLLFGYLHYIFYRTWMQVTWSTLNDKRSWLADDLLPCSALLLLLLRKKENTWEYGAFMFTKMSEDMLSFFSSHTHSKCEWRMKKNKRFRTFTVKMRWNEVYKMWTNF